MNFEYNLLNLLHNVREGGTIIAGYEYGYERDKLKVSGRDGSGYAYVGNLVYRFTGSSFVFESGLFGEGVVSANGICYHLKDHLGSIRAIVDGNGRLLEENDYYAFGQRHPRSEHVQSSVNCFKYNGKEEQTTGGLGYLDYGARMYDAESGRWFGVDPLLEKYYGVSPYVYCANNPLIYTDPDGMVIKLSKMTEEQTSLYDCILRELLSSSKLFKTMYTELENSNAIYVIRFGQTSLDPDGNPVQGDFMPNKDGQGGTITFFSELTSLPVPAVSEEFFHAFQQDNRGKYEDGEFNREFEAKVVVTAIGGEIDGCREYDGMRSFQSKIMHYGQGDMIIPPATVISNAFLEEYNKAANVYADFNRQNKIGGVNYQKNTTVAPYGLQQLILKAYEK